MPPVWKIERELRRVWERGERRARAVYEPVLQWHHDRTLTQNLHVTDGKVAMTGRVAIFVLFQPRGLAPSVAFTCRHLVANGYAPLVISNAPLSDADQAVLKDLAWRVVVRPNFGYDFGAYRDGIQMLWRDGIDPEVLVLMNDSTWFPLRADDDALARLDAMDAQFSGFAYKQEPYGKWGSWHVESHFLRFGRLALHSPQFNSFWTGYHMTSNRVQTVLRGEKAISKLMIEAGFHPVSLVCFASFIAWFVAAPAEVQRDTLARATFHVADRVNDVGVLLDDYADNAAWRLRAIAHVTDMLGSLEFFPTTTFLATSLDVFGQPFIKKSKDENFRGRRFGADRFHLARVKLLDLHDTGVIPRIDPIVEHEVRRAVQARAQAMSASAPTQARHPA